MASESIWHLGPAVEKGPLCMPSDHNGNCRNSRMCYCSACVYISGLLALVKLNKMVNCLLFKQKN